MASESQKEFFEEFQKEKGKIEKIANNITKRQPKLFINLPLENIVLAAIVVIMFLIVSFALGVERGKKIKTISASKKVVVEEILEKKAIPVETKPEVVKPAQVKTAEIKQAQPVKPYAVQLISYKQKDRAEKEKNTLLKKGIDAFVIESGKWHQVCAGGYATFDEAQKKKQILMKDYMGCFIRKK